LPKVQAISPPPDGGYPGGNTAEGYLSLGSLTTGAYNTGVGVYSLLSLTDGRFNTGVGAATLLANTADENTATGAGTLFSNSTGFNNTANGTFALFSNTTGSFNTASGDRALLIAEEVEKVNPDLVDRNNKGEAESVRYDMVNAMLLNEFLKEHKKVKKLEATVVQQQKEIGALTVGLQKVSAQIKVSKPAPQLVANQP
jgi:hypothetical protein